jgi:tetratricopeptide (TPR) repeat protein
LGAEALGVLEVMIQDDPELALVNSYRIARAAALVQLRRGREAIGILSSRELADNPEACAWRLLALTQAALPDQALGQLACARPALTARPAPARRDFILAASRSAIAVDQAAKALEWLRQIPSTDPSANLARGEALLALGQAGEADRTLALVERTGSAAERHDAALSRIEAGVKRRTTSSRQALKASERIHFAWRGDHIEERALQLSYRLSSASGDLRSALAAGSTLFNYFDTRTDRTAFMDGLQQQLAATLDPANGMPLDQAAGLYWDFRELAPIGAEGDFLVTRLADRLQEVSLYARAAELLEHQLVARVRDLAKGPLSAKVATLHILAGHPKLALSAIRNSDRGDYPAPIRWERQRVEAVALVHLGREDEALAALEAVPNGAALRAEIHWRRREWSTIEAGTKAALPAPRSLSEVDQAIVLRHAIALAMLGREQHLSRLRTRYSAAFAGLPSARAFEVLTAAIGTVDPAAIGAAMAAIPTASPAGSFGDLLDAVPAA